MLHADHYTDFGGCLQAFFGQSKNIRPSCKNPQPRPFTFSQISCIIKGAGMRAVPPRGGFPMRKVRASQGRITGNARRGKPQDKCNREIPPPELSGGKGGKAEISARCRPGNRPFM